MSGTPTIGAPTPGLVQARDLPLDAHLHTDQSPDSNVPVDVYAALAAELGIRELAITDHVDFSPGAPAYRYRDVAARERIVRDAADRWAGRGVAIRFGCELTYESAREDDLREHLRRHDYDFTIGSVHVTRESPYHPRRVAAFCAGRSIAAVVAPYVAELTRAARTGLFDTLGHLDIVKRWVHPHLGPADFAAAPELFEPVLRALVDTGTGLEVNSSGLRQEPREPYPTTALVARFREIGGERVTVGSDAHRAEWFALGLADVYRMARHAGFEAIAFRRGGERASIPMPVASGA